MNKKTFLKSLIGTVAIYGVLVAFLIILDKIIDLGLGELWVFPVSFVVCSIAAGLLFKGQMNALVWSASSVIFMLVMLSGDISFIFMGLWFILAPLLFPFYIIKGLRWSWNNTN